MICSCCGKHKRPGNLEALGTALKPAMELIAVARKPLSEKTVAANVLAHGTGAINVDGCRVGTEDNLGRPTCNMGLYEGGLKPIITETNPLGRWPANILHDGSEEVLAAFPESAGGAWPAQGIAFGYSGGERKQNGIRTETNDSGSAARFFYTAKADSDDRLGSKHPTVKPVDLMQWLCRLVTPKGGTVLDPFAGTGTTGEAAFREGFNAVLIEREDEYLNDIRRRMRLVLGGPEGTGAGIDQSPPGGRCARPRAIVRGSRRMIFHFAPHHRLTDWLDCGWMVAPCNAPMHHHEYSFYCVWLCQCKLARPI